MDCEIDLSSSRSEDRLSDPSVTDYSTPDFPHIGEVAGNAWPVAEIAGRSAGLDRFQQKIDELIRRYDDYLTDAPASLAALIFARHRQDLAGISTSIAKKSPDAGAAFKSGLRVQSLGGSLVWQNAETFITLVEDMLSLHQKVVKLVGHNGCGKPVAASDLGLAALEFAGETVNRLGTMMQLHIWSLNQLIADTRARADAFPFASEARLRQPNAEAADQQSNAAGQSVADQNAGRGGLSAWQLRRIDTLVEAEPGKQISVPRLAETVGLSVSHFTRAFKVSTGQPPAHWLLAKRLDLAKTLLVDSDASLAQIAETCGFAEQSHFSKRFRQMTGMTPGDWRRRHK
ncbi:helix-turn-helix domain-containing protein [Dongia soli]|uniref:AraC family transcriptional regulator n=1 Tax=Dongia soli TaxID=600628 RepID=A0ABU5E7Z4_9PROT|nr:AraC family transcriptional regulator [Dongia soli]MDY0881673.1 AraC family transcriptional regulator [Dongia soli]